MPLKYVHNLQGAIISLFNKTLKGTTVCVLLVIVDEHHTIFNEQSV